MDSDGKIVPVGQSGELCTRGRKNYFIFSPTDVSYDTLCLSLCHRHHNIVNLYH